MTNSVGLSAISELFASETLVAVLGRFAAQPERSFYQRELSRLTGSSLYLVQRELARLTRMGLIVRTPRGKHVEYVVDATHPAWPPLRDLMLRTVALAATLREAMSPLAERIALAWVFGSVARGTDTSDSDIDLMVIGDLSLRTLASLELPGPETLGRHLNIVTYTPAGLRDRATDDHFVTQVLASPRIWIIGSDDELAAMVAGRPAQATPPDE